MTRVTFEIDRATAIVLPGPGMAGSDVDAWAAESAAALLAHHDLPAHQHAALSRVLARAQHSAAEDASTNVLTFEPETGAWAPLRLTILDRSIDTDEQRRFLSPPAVLEPRIRMAVSTGLGEGCSSTVREDAQLATVRWLFMTPGRTLFAVLGPLPAQSVLLAAVRAETLLDSVRVEDAVWTPSDAFDPSAAVAAGEREDAVWRI
jgi:hypothetical protein